MGSRTLGVDEDEEKSPGREAHQPGVGEVSLDSRAFTLLWMMSRALPAMLKALHGQKNSCSAVETYKP